MRVSPSSFPPVFAIALMALAILALPAILAGPAHAQRAIEDAQPHPLVPLPPEGFITRDAFTDFAELAFPLGPRLRREEIEMLEVEGAHRQMEYSVEGLELSNLRLYRSYLQYLEGAGFEILFHGIGDDLGTREGYSLLSQTGGLLARSPAVRAGENGYILARSADEETVIALSVYTRQGARRILVNVVEIEEMETLDLFGQPAPADAPVQEEVADEVVAADLVQQDVEELESGLVSDGRVIVNAILFDFDSARIQPESARALETVADLMEERPDLKLLVVGHTDGVGSFDYNLGLSLDRASAVVAWLSNRHGIAGSRLRPAGAGPMSPVTTNRTEEGRALNRRVELVEVID
ncbi:MAG: OmpA family protein [Salinarimonas sp.]